MPIPWLRLIDLALGATSFSRGAQNRAALAEDVDRDARLLALEREQLEAERLRADRALQLERLGQACELEIGRLRLIAAVAVAAVRIARSDSISRLKLRPIGVRANHSR